MKTHEALARQIVLAQAVETCDIQGKLISDAERDQIDSRIAKEVRGVDDPSTTLGDTLARRAALLLDTVQGRSAVITNLQKTQNLQQAMAWVVPVCALIFGVIADRVFNPSRVDLLSQSFLGVLAWNLVVYAAIVLSVFRRSQHQPIAWIEALRHAIASAPIWRRTRTTLGTQIAMAFTRRWQSLTGALTHQRLLGVMHLAAAAWGAGAALSLILRGTVRAYTIGWESTLLNAQQVHAVLSLLSWPLVQIFGIAPFSIDDIARLQFDIGAGASGQDASRWLWMYVGLLLALVVVPRLALAAFSVWRCQQLAKQIHIALDEPYFQRIIDNLSPAVVRLGLLTHHADDLSALQQVLVQERMPLRGQLAPATYKLIETERGDALWTAEVRGATTSQAPPLTGAVAWRNWRNWAGLAEATTQEAASVDLVLHVVGREQDLADALATLQSLHCPVLMLVRSNEVLGPAHAQLRDQCRLHQRNNDLSMDILDFEGFARCWVQDHNLLGAIARHVPRARTQGYARLTQAWEQRNQKRFSAAMAAMVEALSYAARQAEELPKLGLIERVSTEKRQAHTLQEQAAMQAVLQKVKLQDHAYVQRLLALHSLASDPTDALSLNGKFALQTAVSAPRAAMGGAASGAAMGASIDLLTGGLTLGAAAALGALAGGGVAFAGALWNNRTAPNGGIRVCLSDDMLLALMQACVLRYIAVIHLHRDTAGVDADTREDMWKLVVAEALQSHKKPILVQLEIARKENGVSKDFVELTEKMARQVLHRLYPVARF